MSRHLTSTALFAAIAFSFCAANAQGATLSPPPAGYVMGLNAAIGVTTTGGNVTAWNDEVTNANLYSASIGTSPTTTTNSFVTPNGNHAAIVFTGSNGLLLNNASALNLQNLSIYVVGNLSQNNTSAEFIANYSPSGGVSRGWADGISDFATNQTKWFSGPDGADTLGGTTNISLNPGSGRDNAYLTIETASVTGPGVTTKSSVAYNKLFLANVQNSSPLSDTVSTINYVNDGSQQVGVGYLPLPSNTGGQWLTGDIAEVLVYDNSIPGFSNAAVMSYLEAEFFTPEPSTVWSCVSLLAMAGIGLVIKRRGSRRSAAVC